MQRPRGLDHGRHLGRPARRAERGVAAVVVRRQQQRRAGGGARGSGVAIGLRRQRRADVAQRRQSDGLQTVQRRRGPRKSRELGVHTRAPAANPILARSRRTPTATGTAARPLELELLEPRRESLRVEFPLFRDNDYRRLLCRLIGSHCSSVRQDLQLSLLVAAVFRSGESLKRDRNRVTSVPG